MKVTVRLLSGADHLSQILTGFQMLSLENKLTLDILDCRKDSPVYQEAFLEAQVNGIRILFDLMDGYFYNDPAAVLALFVLCYPRIFAVTFDETFSRATGVHTQAYNMLLAVLTAVTIVLGMRMMGALLISSLIIFPALTAMRVFGTFRSVTICAAVVSVVNFLLGMVLSYVLETPSGASVVVVDLVVFLLFCGVQRIQCRVKK